MTLKLKHGEIWLANLNPTRGTGSGKVRPILIIQNQILLDCAHPSTLIIPLTTQLIDEAEPLRLRFKKSHKLLKDSDLLIDQLRAIDNKRILDGPLAQCDAKFMRTVYQAMQKVLGIPITVDDF